MFRTKCPPTPFSHAHTHTHTHTRTHTRARAHSVSQTYLRSLPLMAASRGAAWSGAGAGAGVTYTILGESADIYLMPSTDAFAGVKTHWELTGADQATTVKCSPLLPARALGGLAMCAPSPAPKRLPPCLHSRHAHTGARGDLAHPPGARTRTLTTIPTATATQRRCRCRCARRARARARRYAFGFMACRWGWESAAYIDEMLTAFRTGGNTTGGGFPIDAFISDFEWYTPEPDYALPAAGTDSFKDFDFDRKGDCKSDGDLGTIFARSPSACVPHAHAARRTPTRLRLRLPLCRGITAPSLWPSLSLSLSLSLPPALLSTRPPFSLAVSLVRTFVVGLHALLGESIKTPASHAGLIKRTAAAACARYMRFHGRCLCCNQGASRPRSPSPRSSCCTTERTSTSGSEGSGNPALATSRTSPWRAQRTGPSVVSDHHAAAFP